MVAIEGTRAAVWKSPLALREYRTVLFAMLQSAFPGLEPSCPEGSAHRHTCTPARTPGAKGDEQTVFSCGSTSSGASEAERPEVYLELMLLEDDAMERLHKEALGCEGPTNILAFPAQNECETNAPHAGRTFFLPQNTAACAEQSALCEEEQTPGFLGSLALSVDTMARECFLYGQPTYEYCIRLLAHGTAHLLGYDHGPAMDEKSAQLEHAARSAVI